MHRFFISPAPLGDTVSLSDREQVHQIRDVLKLTSGERVGFFDGSGSEWECEVLVVDKKEITFAVLGRRELGRQAQRSLTLFCAILKHDTFDWVVQKAVETGADRVVPVITERTIKRSVAPERMARIAREAAEQSGRGTVPNIEEPCSFLDALKRARDFDVSVFLEKSDILFTHKDCAQAKTIAVFVGPEGGWTDRECALAEQSGCAVRSLGPLILRSETAATVASFIAAQL